MDNFSLVQPTFDSLFSSVAYRCFLDCGLPSPLFSNSCYLGTVGRSSLLYSIGFIESDKRVTALLTSLGEVLVDKHGVYIASPVEETMSSPLKPDDVRYL